MGDEHGGIWMLVERDGERVVLKHGDGRDPVPVAHLILSAEGAASLGAALIAYAIDVDPEATREQVLRVLAPLAYGN